MLKVNVGIPANPYDPTGMTVMPNTKFIIMDENINPSTIPSATSGAVLLPPPDVLIEYMDTEDVNTFIFKYHMYLRNNATDFIVAFIYDAQYNGSNVCICLDDNYRIYWDHLLSYLYIRYGVLYDLSTGALYFDNDCNKKEMLRLELINLGLVDHYTVTNKMYPNVVHFGGPRQC